MSESTKSGIVQPYLFFAGRCQEALDFYRDALGARIGMVTHFSQSPDPVPEGCLQPGFEDKVMHCEFTIGETTILASDGTSEASGFKNVSLAYQVATEAEVDQAFAALAEGGVVQMPPGETFWSKRFCMVEDKFGLGWMINVPQPSTQGA